MMTEADARKILEAAKASDENIAGAMAGLQAGMMMGLTKGMDLKHREFLEVELLTKFINDKTEGVWRFAVGVVFRNSFWHIFYYEGVE